MMRFVKKEGYYTGTVYEFNLPTGTTCPGADQCKVVVDLASGKFNNQSTVYRCYAASAERFPGVRKHRWTNFNAVKQGQPIKIPDKARAIRIHSAGDFFNQSYFDQWLSVCLNHPDVEFWAYTKSVNYWVKRKDKIPPNLILTASVGGRFDHLIESHQLKHARVTTNPLATPIDTNDDLARTPHINFFLLDNHSKQKRILAKEV